jgi:hypothetical protein
MTKHVTETEILVELPHGNHVPAQADILRRFRSLYLNDQYLTPVLTACAEEAERMMHELFIYKEKRPLRIRLQRLADSSRTIRQLGYSCPRCLSPLKASHQFCPGCGRRIEWT